MMDAAEDLAETLYTLFTGEPDDAPVGFTIRMVKPLPAPN